MKTCPNCGRPMTDAAKFCGGCGAELPAVQTCLRCGATLRPGTKFCNQCGASADGQVPVVSPAPRKPRKTLAILLPILAAVLVLALVAGGFFWWKSAEADTETRPTASQREEHEEREEEPEEPESEGPSAVAGVGILGGLFGHSHREETPAEEPSAEPEVPAEDKPAEETPVAPPEEETPAEPSVETPVPPAEEPEPPAEAPEETPAVTFTGDVEAEVENIRAIYNEITLLIATGDLAASYAEDGSVSYSDGSAIWAIYAEPGTDYAYSRFYYYLDGQLFFAYYEAEDAFRFYFWEDQLIRLRYSFDVTDPQDAVNLDLDSSQEILALRDAVLAESQWLMDLHRG